MRLSSTLARLGVTAFLFGSSPVVALTIEYCSSENTAASDTLQTSVYQSNGLCEDQCNADYAFAVLLYESCWCSNYIPADQSSVSECDSACPGYPDDLCGNKSKKLYGYIAMNKVKPSGTASGTGTSAASTSSSGSTATTQSVSQTTPSTTFTTSLASSGSSATDGQTTSSGYISVQTVAGQPVTVTVGNPSPAGTSGAGASTGSKSLSGGAIAGIVIGTLVGAGALVALGLWFFFFGRRRDEPSEKSPTPESRYDPSVFGTGSENRRQSKGSQMSFMRNFMAPSEQQRSPTSPNDYLNPNQAFTDNRMKKDAVLYPNGNRHSAVSLRDEEDYSRPVLRLTNPD